MNRAKLKNTDFLCQTLKSEINKDSMLFNLTFK